MINSILSYLKGVWSELKKVTWPTRQEVINHTAIVIASIALAIAITSAIDYGLTTLVQYLVTNKG